MWPAGQIQPTIGHRVGPRGHPRDGEEPAPATLGLATQSAVMTRPGPPQPPKGELLMQPVMGLSLRHSCSRRIKDTRALKLAFFQFLH